MITGIIDEPLIGANISFKPYSGSVNALLNDPLMGHTHLLYGGHGRIGGDLPTGIVTVRDNPARRRVVLLDRNSLKCVATQWSKADGSYGFTHLDENRDFILFALDHLKEYEPPAYDWVRPVAMSN